MNKNREIFQKISKDLMNNKVPMVDLHIHTNWTDGKHSVKEMYNEACKKKLNTILYSEHVRATSFDWFVKFTGEIRSLKRKSCKALVGAESKILNYKGDIDINDKVIKKCDLIMGSVHRFPGESGINNPSVIAKYSKKEAIEIEFELSLSALKNSPIDILGHPFGMSYSRYKTEPSWKQICELIVTSKKYNKAFEINSFYHIHAKKMLQKCLSVGTLISLGSNAHTKNDIGNVQKMLL